MLRFLFCTIFLLSYRAPGHAQDRVLPILAWYSIPDSATSVQRYQELKATGINHSFTFHKSADAVARALDAAAKTGVKLIISCPELERRPEETVRRFKEHPALAGYFLRDEPVVADFEGLAKWARRIQAVDTAHFCYLNLLPTYANLQDIKAASYREYVRQYIETVPTQILSYDHYPVVEQDGRYTLRADFYENLEIFADEAQKAGKPFWAFSLAVAHTPYPIPDLAQMRLQLFSNLAYGAQGLQYFTYWTPGKNPNWNFHHGPIGLDGRRTDVYDKVKALNDEIHAYTSVFLGAKVLQVRHLGESIPKHTTRLTTLPGKVLRLEMKGADGGQAGAVLSELQNKGHRYLLILNRDFQQPMQLELALAPGAERMHKDGRSEPASAYSETLMVDPGDVLIYRLE